MAVNKELLERFKLKQTAEAANLKMHVGEFFRVGKYELNEYVDVTGAYHKVLAIQPMGTTDIYRTEVAAFIEKFNAYIDVFGDCPPEELPYIKITGKTSKKRNEYISFDLVDESGNTL